MVRGARELVGAGGRRAGGAPEKAVHSARALSFCRWQEREVEAGLEDRPTQRVRAGPASGFSAQGDNRFLCGLKVFTVVLCGL